MPRLYTSAAGVALGSLPNPPPPFLRSSGAVIAARFAFAIASASVFSSSSSSPSSFDSHTGPGLGVKPVTRSGWTLLVLPAAATIRRRLSSNPRAASGSYDSMTASAISSVVAATLAMPAPTTNIAAVSLLTFFFVCFIPYSPSLASLLFVSWMESVLSSPCAMPCLCRYAAAAAV